MNPVVSNLVKLGLSAATALLLEKLGIDPAHVAGTVNQTGTASGEQLDKLLNAVVAAANLIPTK